MSRTHASLAFKAKALLCTALTLAVPIVAASCGPTTTNTAGETLIALTPDHPLTAALKGSIFEGATALAVSPGGGQFRLIHPNSALTLRGRYASDGSIAAVNEFVIGREANLTTLTIDANKRITTISANGLTWQRPANWTSKSDPSAPTSTEALLAANAELIQAANETGQIGATSGSTSTGGSTNGGSGTVIPKQTSAAQAELFFLVLAPLAAVWVGLIAAPLTVPIGLLIAPLAFIVGATITVIGVITGILPALGLTAIVLAAPLFAS